MDTANRNQGNSFLQLLGVEDIFRIILEFITPQSTWAIKGCAPANALFATAKELRKAKQKYFYWKFTRDKSLQYLVDPAFRATCESLIDNTARSMALTFAHNRSIADVSMLDNVHTLDLRGCTGITDVSMLGTVQSLYLNGCTGITDVSMLGTVQTLDLSAY